MIVGDMRLTRERVGLDEVVVDAEEAFYGIETPNFLDGVLVTLRIGLFLAPVSP